MVVSAGGNYAYIRGRPISRSYWVWVLGGILPCSSSTLSGAGLTGRPSQPAKAVPWRR